MIHKEKKSLARRMMSKKEKSLNRETTIVAHNRLHTRMLTKGTRVSVFDSEFWNQRKSDIAMRVKRREENSRGFANV